MNGYVVKQAFEYNGTSYKPGDEWEPEGFRNDDKIMEGETLVRPARKAKRLRLKTQRTQGTQKSAAVVEDRDAQAYEMYHEHGMTLEEVGEQLDIAASTVSRAIKRHEKRMED